MTCYVNFILSGFNFRGSFSVRKSFLFFASTASGLHWHEFTISILLLFIPNTISPRSRGRLIKTWLDPAWLIATANFMVFLQLLRFKQPTNHPRGWFLLIMNTSHRSIFVLNAVRLKFIIFCSYHYSSSDTFFRLADKKISHDDLHFGQRLDRILKEFSLQRFRLDYTYTMKTMAINNRVVFFASNWLLFCVITGFYFTSHTQLIAP